MDNPSGMLHPDSVGYDLDARALLRTGCFAMSPDRPHQPEIVRTPGYPLFIAMIYRVCGERPGAVIVAQILVSVGTLALLFLLTRDLFGPAVAVVAALLLALDPVSLAY